MSNKTIIASILVVIGVVINFVTALSGFNIDPENSEHLAGAIGMALPGILIAAVIGLVVALIAHLFSKERKRDKFFLAFSIFFLTTILIIAWGASENRKIENDRASVNDTQELSAPYTSNSENFRVTFPTEPKIAQNDYSPYGVEGNAAVYISTKETSEGEVIYYVIVNNMRALAFVDDNGRKNYYEQFPIIGLSDAGAEVVKISSTVRNVYNDIEGVEYKYRLKADNEVLFKRGIDFIKDGKGYQVSIIYSSNLDSQIESIYSNFISSFELF